MPALKVIIAPTAFKGTLTPNEAATAVALGLRRQLPGADFLLRPVSDGGDGFLECLVEALDAERRSAVVRGPLHVPVAVPFGITGARTGIVEAAQAIGLSRVPAASLDALAATSGGLGEVLAEVRQAGATEVLVGLGGSASTDGGSGMARALGYRFLDRDGRELPEGGGYLCRLDRIDATGFDPAWLLLGVRVACDVDNPLLGPRGCAATYGPQKGASPAGVAQLEEGLGRLASAMERDLGVRVQELPYAGSAGGLGAGMFAFLGAELLPGSELVLDAVGLRPALQGATLLVTGEGRLDAQSLSGKAPVEAGRWAMRAGVPALALVGSVGPGWEGALGDAFQAVQVVGGAGEGGTDIAPAARLEEAAALLDLDFL